MDDTPHTTDKEVTRPGFWKKLKGIISVAVTGRGTMYMSDKKGGWEEMPFSRWKENGTYVEYLPDGRVHREIDFENGKDKEIRGRIWDDERFRLRQKSPNYEETVWRGGECVRKERLFRQELTITPFQNDKPEGIQEIYRPIDERGEVTEKTKTLGNYYLSETQEYHNGYVDGERRCYYQSGVLQEVATLKSRIYYYGYSKDEFEKMKRYKPELNASMWVIDEVGRHIRVEPKIYKCPIGVGETYYPNGRLKSYVKFDKNVTDATEFDEEGNVSSALRQENGRWGGYLRNEEGEISLYFQNDEQIKTVEIDVAGHRSVSTEEVRHTPKPESSSILLDGFYSGVNDKGHPVEFLYKDNMLVQRVTFERGRPVLAEKINELGEAVSFPPEERIKRPKIDQRLKEMGLQVQQIDPSRTHKLPEELFQFHLPVDQNTDRSTVSSKKMTISKVALMQKKSSSK